MEKEPLINENYIIADYVKGDNIIADYVTRNYLIPSKFRVKKNN